MPKLELHKMLQDSNLTLVGMDETSGLPVVETPEGEEVKFNYKALMKDQGIDPSTPVTLNTPMTALEDISPLSVEDRSKLSFGNARGQLKFLKREFQDAKYDDEKGFVVKQGDVWRAVDPSGLGTGNPWEMTKELIKDASDWLSEGTLIGATTAGGALGGPGGAVGGAAAGSALTTSLGRAWGTYDASMEERLFDIAFDTMFALGGEVVAAGAKPALKQLTRSAKKIAKTANPAVKDMWSSTFGRITGAGVEHADILLNNPDDVIRQMNVLKRAKASPLQVDNILTRKMMNKSRVLVEGARKGLTKQYGQALDDIISSPEAVGFKADFSAILDNMARFVDENGLGKVVRKRGKLSFEPLSDEAFRDAIVAGKAARVLEPTTQKALNRVFNQLNTFTKSGTLQGPKAIKPLVNMNQILNDAVLNLPATAPANSGRIIKQLSSTFKNSVVKQFDDVGLAGRYTNMQRNYGQFVDAVEFGQKALDKGPVGLEGFVNQLMAGSGKKVSINDFGTQLASLGGRPGQKMLHDIRVLSATKAFAPILPKMGGFPGIATGGAIGGAATVASGSGIGAALPIVGTAALFSPKAAFLQIKAAHKGLGFLRSLPPVERNALLNNPQAMRSLIQTIGGVAQEQQQIETQLLQQVTQ